MTDPPTYEDIANALGGMACLLTKQDAEIKRLKARLKKLQAFVKAAPDSRQLQLFEE